MPELDNQSQPSLYSTLPVSVESAPYRHHQVPLENEYETTQTSSNIVPKRRSGRSRSTFEQGSTSHNSTQVQMPLGQSARQRRRAVQRNQTGLDAANIAMAISNQYLRLQPGVDCPKCLAMKFAYESPGFCCADGAVHLPTNPYPHALTRLYTSGEEDAVHFRKYSRMYNNMFAYSSIGGRFDSQTIKGIYVFKLHGQIYHNVPDLIPGDGCPKYLQLYFYDGEHESLNRTNCFPEVREDVVDILIQITAVNPYARFFRSLREHNAVEHSRILISQNPVLDQRVYNAPTSTEVAAIWSESSSSSESAAPHIIVTANNNSTHRIMHYYGCYDPLQYPLLFPYGECGWVHGLKCFSSETGPLNLIQNGTLTLTNAQTVTQLIEDEQRRADQSIRRKDKVVSCRRYYCYKLQMRPNNMLLRTGRCFQQYLVDMYVKVENTRLDYFRNNQDTIRAELYQGIIDHVNAGEHDAATIGKRIILPPTFLGGPRDMKRRYLNSMSLVHRYGKPDLFVTMTCNPNWPEIKEQLTKEEEVHNRPDIVARVFRAKLVVLKKQIVKKKVFGEVAAYVYVVEFQKRGLPHVHFLIILKEGYKLKSPVDYDKYVCAEVPTSSNPLLQASVLKHMMHGPCGALNMACPCMKHPKTPGKCRFNFPKTFASTTTVNSAGYPEYRRRDTGVEVLIRNHKLDNRWVIPYNPYLLAMFDCHINVEVCSTIGAVKYLYKYVYKGHDRISFSVTDGDQQTSNDEIAQFQSGRWVSPCEAAWRIFGFELFETQPPVVILQVHLPRQQTICLRPHENLANILANNKRSRTTLTEYFKESAKEDCPQLLYGEFPEHYRWDANKKSWARRKNRVFGIGRLVFVAPSEGERFYLRLLLLHIHSPTSFESILNVNGYICATFQEAAIRNRLFEDDNAAELCMAEARTVQMPVALRRLFSTLLIFSQPKDPPLLWETNYEYMSEDYRYKFPNQPQKVQQLTARAVEQYLEAMGKTLESFGLDHLNTCTDDEIRRTRDIIDALDSPIPDEIKECSSLLNTAQREAFIEIMNHVVQTKPGAFFVDGPGGTGKTFLYNALYAEVRLLGKIVLPTATSGIAASNLPSGRTSHSRFKIPIDCDTSLSCDVPKQGSLAALIVATSLIIWDEASMAKRQNIESLDTLLRDLCDPNLLFGGKVVVFGGDFRQTLPVVPRKSQREVVESSLVSSPLWPKLIKFKLTENIRAQSDPAFAQFLLLLGNGKLQRRTSEYVQLPPGIVRDLPTDREDSIKLLTSIIFPEMSAAIVNPDIFTTRAIITPLNDDVDLINNNLIDQYPGTPVGYRSYDSMLDDSCTVYPAEFINKLNPGGMSPHNLILKENCPVILLRNLQPSFGLCNGTRLICRKFYQNAIECVIMAGHHKGEHVFIPRIKLRPAASANYPFQFQRNQYPLKLSFAMTINKCQGQTLERVAVYLPQPCFAHGQLYVAVSRARKESDVTILATPGPETTPKQSVKNIVAYDALCLAGIV